MSQQPHNRPLSGDSFVPLNRASTEMARPNDATIDIPLTSVVSSRSTGARKTTSTTVTQNAQEYSDPHFDEKRGHFSSGQAGKRKRKFEQSGREARDKDDGTMNVIGQIYYKIYNTSIITRYFLYVAPLGLCIAVPIIIGATVAQNATIGGVRIVWFFAWIEVLWCSLWVAKLFAKALPYIFQFLSGVVSSGVRKYALVIAALEIPISLVGWSVASLTTFVPLMTLNPTNRANGDTALKNWEVIIKNILFACLFSSVVFLAEKLLVQLISISYHRTQFDDRIKESKRNMYLLSLLYDASRTLFPSYCPEFAEEDYLISDVLDIQPNGKRDKRSGAQTPLRLFQNVARVGDKVTAAFGNVAQEITGKQVFNPTSSHSVIVHAFERKHSTEALARRIWMSFVLEGKDALSIEDIIDVLGSGREAEAEEAFHCLDVDSNGDISLDEMVLRVSEFSRERKSIANSMHDVDQAIHVLDSLLCTIVLIIVVFIFVAWLNSNFTTTLATAGTALLSLSFVFAGTAQEVLGSCIFLFVKHPFDVGDRVDVSEVQYVVERISLLYTTFRRVKDNKRTQCPNIVLNSNWIDNVSRSKAMFEAVTVAISFDTTFEDIELFKKEMLNFVRDKDNARDFQPDLDVEVTNLAEQKNLELKIEIRHKSNWSNESVRAARRSKFMCALVIALKKVPIYGPGGGGKPAGDPANPNYSVVISDEQAQSNKAAAADDKDKSRMIPLLSHDSDTDKGSSTSFQFDNDVAAREAREASHAQELTRRKPTTDPVRDPMSSPVDTRLDRKRTQDIEQVRGMLRADSTTGRRKASQNTQMSQLPSVAAGSVSTFPSAPTTMRPTSPPGSQPPPQIHYYNDRGQSIHSDSQSRSASSNQPPIIVQPLNYSQPQPNTQTTPRPDRQDSYLASPVPGSFPLTTSQTQAPAQEMGTNQSATSRYVPGNAFSEQAHSQQSQSQSQTPSGPQHGHSQSQSRKPVPGIGEMKGYLQHGQPPK